MIASREDENMYKVSCIVPVYNLETKIERCIKSLLAQTLDCIEIILVNDCSTDNSLAILNHYADRYTNITVIDLQQNMRQGGARNRGLDAATGKYVLFVDGDDWIEENMLKELYDTAEENSFDIVDSDYYQDDEYGNTAIKISMDKQFFPIESIKPLLCSAGRIWTKLINRDLLIKNNIRFIERKKFEDNPYLPILLAYTSNIGKVNKPFYHYIYNADSTSRKKNDFTVFDRLDTALYLLDEAQKRNIFYKYKNEYEYIFIQLYYVNTLIICVTKFDWLPLRHIIKVYDGLNQFLPDYKNNKYVSNAPRYIRIFTKLNKISLLLLCTILYIVNRLGFYKLLVKAGKINAVSRDNTDYINISC